jgi:NAD dependent epimerase/dehydratase family enzyme
MSGVLGGNEVGAPDTWRFSIDLARAWEQAFEEATTARTRKVALRSAMTMSPDASGILRYAHEPGATWPRGDGRQLISWIHHEDFAEAIRWLIDHDGIVGVVNVASPNPLPNADFMRTLRDAAGVTIGLPASRWMLEIGAVFMRTETELILKSRPVVPARLL